MVVECRARVPNGFDAPNLSRIATPIAPESIIPGAILKLKVLLLLSNDSVLAFEYVVVGAPCAIFGVVSD